MKIRNLLFLTLTFLAYGSNVALSANITEDKYYYYVKGVKAEDISANDNETTKKVALDNVKRLAMDALQEKLGENLQLDETNLNSAIGGYKIVDEYYDKDFYSIVADFNFSKIVINSFIKNSKKKDVKLASNTVDAVVVLKEKYSDGLFVRCILSTVIGETVDSIIFISISFIGVLPSDVVLTMICCQIVFKSLYEILAYPVTRKVIFRLRTLDDGELKGQI